VSLDMRHSHLLPAGMWIW